MSKSSNQAYVVTVDMGYGHQRAAYPLKDIAASPIGWNGDEGGRGSIITANSYPGIPKSDRRRWEGGRAIYEKISRMKGVPLIGKYIFGAMDYLQRIKPFYPKRDLSEPSLQVRQIHWMIKKGWGRHLIEVLNKKPLPYVTSFFSTAFFAEEHGYKEDIYAICTDTDISRAWVTLNPKKSRIKYLAPNRRVRERLIEYGVKAPNIYVTGFPLPKENVGGQTLGALKKSLGQRLDNLDPVGRYRNKYQNTIKHYLGTSYISHKSKHPLTITFAVGGAGAQREIGATIMHSLKHHIREGEVILNLVAGVRNDIYNFYEQAIKKCNLQKGGVNLLRSENKMDYFARFNQALLKTDILWTKPSELSFYAGLGLPIIMAPSVGAQEDFNASWLHATHAGFEQNDPQYTHEWLFDWLDSGWLAQAAMEGFMNAPHNGVYHVEDVVLKGVRSEIEDIHFI